MKRSVCLILNPVAGPGDVLPVINCVSSFWRDRGWKFSILETKAAGHAADLAHHAAERGCELVLVAGGDGTIGQVAHGLAGSETIMGIIPVGTANVFAKLLNMAPQVKPDDFDLLGICQLLSEGTIQRMDLGRAHTAGLPESGYRFVSWVGAGLDGRIIGRMEPRPIWVKQITGRRLGWTSYLMVGVQSAMSFSGVPTRVTVDGRVFEDTFVMILVANSRLYGGGMVKLCSDSCLDDGVLDVWLFKGKMFHDTVAHLVRLLMLKHLTSPDTVRVRGRRVLIRPERETAIEIDGEPAPGSPLYVTIDPGALRLLTPSSAPSDLFDRPGIPFLCQG